MGSIFDNTVILLLFDTLADKKNAIDTPLLIKA